MKATRFRALALLPLLGAACAHYPFVVAPAFAPPPRNLAVVAYHAGPIYGGIMGIPLAGESVAGPYQVFRQSLAASGLFRLAPDQAVVAAPAYLTAPVGSLGLASSPPGLRPVRLGPGIAATLARALGANVVVAASFQPEIWGEGIGTAVVHVGAEILAWDGNGLLVWKDRVWANSGQFVRAFGVSDPGEVQRRCAQAMSVASQLAVGRLQRALAGG